MADVEQSIVPPASGAQGGQAPGVSAVGAEEKVEVSKKEYEELTKLREKDMNFENLRKKAETAEKTKEQLSEESQKAQEALKQELENKQKEWQDKFVKDQYETTFKGELNRLSGGSEELKKKIEFNYNRLGGGTNPEEITSRMAEAYLLSTGKQAQQASPLHRVSGSSGNPAYPGNAGGYQEEANSFADSQNGASLLQHMFPKNHYPNVPWNKEQK